MNVCLALNFWAEALNASNMKNIATKYRIPLIVVFITVIKSYALPKI
jgi:hypothetical protein